MSADSSHNDGGETLRRAARTGIQTSGGVIVDTERVATLAEQITAQRREEAHDNTSEISDTSDAGKAMTENLNTTIAGPEIDGMQIGSGQSAEFDSLDAHYKKICNCQNCELGATRTKFVYGVGSPTADLMFVGEAPGKNEDLQGEPFVGRAGQLLDKILAAINLSRPEIYIANILKCRPPGNRDPQPAEMEQCFPYLKEQIALVQPKILCSLGRISAQALLQTTTPLGKMRGQWHSYQGIPLRVTYHPAALLRNPNFKRGCWEDMQIIEAEYKRLTG